MSAPTYPDLTVSAPPECDCMALGAQLCHAYENWCSEADYVDDYNSLPQEERHALATSEAAFALSRTFGGLLAPDVPF